MLIVKYMEYTVNLKATHDKLYNELITYIHNNNMGGIDDWDDEARCMWTHIKRFRQFCEDYFNIDIEETLNHD